MCAAKYTEAGSQGSSISETYGSLRGWVVRLDPLWVTDTRIDVLVNGYTGKVLKVEIVSAFGWRVVGEYPVKGISCT